jgi:glycosyltransferase involved in cell wall biosynthesis
MKIAIIGTRGVPARYGGFETCAEELSVGLVNKGHKVIVTCRKYLYPEKFKYYKGVKLIYLPSIRGKFTDTFSHTFLSILRVLFESPDIILIFNSANSPFAIIGKISGKKIVINVDGLEWKRKKWNIIGKIYFKFCEILSCILGDAIVSDSKEIKKYYKRKYGKETIYIPYGAYFYESKKPEILEKYGVKKRKYFLIASRLEPENNQDKAVEAFQKVKTDKLLVIAGGANWKSPYVKRLKNTNDKRIIFLGPVYHPGHIEELHANAFAYIHGNEVGGTNPALLKAMGSGNCIICFDVPFNREVLGDCGFYFKDVNELKEKIEYLLKNPEVVERYGKMARERTEKLYRWEKIIDDYENLFLKILK